MQRTATHSQTNEQALEAAIELALTGTSQERLKKVGITTDLAEAAVPYRAGNKFYLGEPQDFDAQLAIDTRRLWHFLETTQGKELDKIKVQPDWRKTLLHRLDKMIQRYGTLYVLRKGLDVADAHFTLFYSVPLASSSAEVWARFEQNEFSVTRQVRYNTLKSGEEIDLVIFINGLPIITTELKNAWTGQTARVNGIHQYKTGRDAAQPLLQFGRCLVHFAADTEEVWMTTRLAGSATVFLPFNKGHKEGAGNPPNPDGHKTAYLWKEVLTRYSLGEIIEHFVTLEGKPADPLAKRNLLFPRYHQLDVVRRLIGDAAQKGVGQTYLIQHSAGSGKSNSITWTAYRLIELYPSTDSIPGSKGLTEPLFDSVIVVTDRRVLDRQLKDNIREFAQVRNIVAHATTSAELKAALESGKKIIITTIQKFPHIVSGIADLSDKRFAVIIDEAHSSQSGSAADNMNRAMGKREEDEERDAQDLILEAMRSRKMRGNASYFAFTATPKPTTLEKFGIEQADGSFKPFHLYSMKQAIEEGFILDVLANYTTYRSYYEIEKSIEDNPLFDTVRAQKKLKAFVERHEQTIATKAEIMLDHFLSHVVAPKMLKGKAKGMVVTQSIESAIQYYFAIKKLLAEKGNPFKIVIAFSGKKLVKGQEYTEESLNGFSSADIKDQFDTDEYRLLVVANKFLTGFDQPKLTAMYVDKKLQGVLAVQALSRLNRSAPWLGKKTEDLFVLDFFNEVEDIKAAFDDFYTATTLSRATDVNLLHELMGQLEVVGVYEWSEVEAFVAGYFAGVDAQELSPIIQTAAERFNNELELEDNEKADFKIKAKHFVKVYGQMAALLPYEVVRWEKLFWFLKFLIPHLLITDPVAGAIDELLDSVDLSTYGLERTKLGHSIVLDPAEAELDPANPNPRSAHGGDAEEDPLDIIVRSFNERWFTGWDATPEEQRVKFVALARHVQEHPNFQSQYVNNPDVQNRELAFSKIVADAINKQRRTDLDLYRLFAQDESFRQAMLQAMRRIVGG